MIPTHESSRVCGVGAHFAVHFDESLFDDLEHFVTSERVLEPVPQEDDQRQALAQLVRARRGPRRVHAAQLVQHPCLRRVQPLQVLLRPARLRHRHNITSIVVTTKQWCGDIGNIISAITLIATLHKALQLNIVLKIIKISFT